MDAVEEVKSHLDIVDIAGEYLPLKPAGSGSFKTCCPFHQEKTPSFFVNRQRQSWHCFGCDKGGDVISFVMDMEGMEFRDALELLAQKAGVALPAFDNQKAGERKRLHEVNDLAARFFRAQLLAATNAEHARAYAAKREIDELTGDLFRIGYAPNSWDALTNALKTKGVTEDEMLKAGLVGKSQRGSGVYDRFRDRLMFAITDVHGNVVGFTGRLLNADAKEAKYVNTPETLVYKKSAVLYALDKAKGDVKSKDLCVIVEGNMDALSSHRAGIQNVVASSGTALTAEQLKLISRFTTNIAIAFDADAAGLDATLRGLDLARSQDFNIRIITLPEGAKDPDDAISKDPSVWERAINEAREIMDWIFRSAFKGRNLADPQEKRAIAARVLPEIKRIADPIVRDHWIKKLAEGLETSEQALVDALRRVKSTHVNQSDRSEQGKGQEAVLPKHSRERELAERLLALVFLKPAFLEQFPVNFGEMLDEDLSTVYNDLVKRYDSGHLKEATPPERRETAPEQTHERLEDIIAIRADRDYPNQTEAGLTSEFTTNLAAFQQERRSAERKRLEEEMRAAELAGDRARIDSLARRFHELM